MNKKKTFMMMLLYAMRRTILIKLIALMITRQGLRKRVIIIKALPSFSEIHFTILL